MLKKIFKITQVLDAAGISFAQFQRSTRFSIKKVYIDLKGCYQKVPWRRLICNNHVTPKWLFILYLTLLKRLYTRDNWRSVIWLIITFSLSVVLMRNLLTTCFSNAHSLLLFGTSYSLGEVKIEMQWNGRRKSTGDKLLSQWQMVLNCFIIPEGILVPYFYYQTHEAGLSILS